MKTVEELTQEVIKHVRELGDISRVYPIDDKDIACIAGIAFQILTDESIKNKLRKPKNKKPCPQCKAVNKKILGFPWEQCSACGYVYKSKTPDYMNQ